MEKGTKFGSLVFAGINIGGKELAKCECGECSEVVMVDMAKMTHQVGEAMTKKSVEDLATEILELAETTKRKKRKSKKTNGHAGLPMTEDGDDLDRDDLTGAKLNMLTVIQRAEDNVDKWLCQCDCGSDPVIVKGWDIRNKKRKSCGCSRYVRA